MHTEPNQITAILPPIKTSHIFNCFEIIEYLLISQLYRTVPQTSVPPPATSSSPTSSTTTRGRTRSWVGPQWPPHWAAGGWVGTPAMRGTRPGPCRGSSSRSSTPPPPCRPWQVRYPFSTVQERRKSSST